MHFHVQMINDPANADRRAQSVPAHWAYLARHAAHILARGPVVADDDETATLGSVFFVEFLDWNSVHRFIEHEPHKNNGIYKEIFVNRWHPSLVRPQSEFLGEKGRIHWYVRGYARRGKTVERDALLDAQRQYFAPFDYDAVIVRGAIIGEESQEWLGSAALIAAPTRDAIESLIAESPFSKSGLYDRVVIQRHKFGGASASHLPDGK